MTLTLYYHPLSSFCWKVLVALYDAELPFRAQLVDLGNASERDALCKLWPPGRFPVLLDDEVVVPESSIIIEHLAQRHAAARSLVPVDPEAALRVRARDRLFDLDLHVPRQKICSAIDFAPPTSAIHSASRPRGDSFARATRSSRISSPATRGRAARRSRSLIAPPHPRCGTATASSRSAKRSRARGRTSRDCVRGRRSRACSRRPSRIGRCFPPELRAHERAAVARFLALRADRDHAVRWLEMVVAVGWQLQQEPLLVPDLFGMNLAAEAAEPAVRRVPEQGRQ